MTPSQVLFRYPVWPPYGVETDKDEEGKPSADTEDKNKESKSSTSDRLVDLMVKASASRAEDHGFESRLRRDFFGVESYAVT